MHVNRRPMPTDVQKWLLSVSSSHHSRNEWHCDTFSNQIIIKFFGLVGIGIVWCDELNSTDFGETTKMKGLADMPTVTQINTFIYINLVRDILSLFVVVVVLFLWEFVCLVSSDDFLSDIQRQSKIEFTCRWTWNVDEVPRRKLTSIVSA